ncbi:mitochondrial substrate carrier family protein [Hibiscus syriacus]|uniref:Mitochondrial substrate carrier family protein n=1 Tax=Hibiscus syriacus TaxID=106335 RepID=A0A6A2WU60_HIBSY|nr:mitochondrial substrate carrier family protein [Hibiscus syriacus]
MAYAVKPIFVFILFISFHFSAFSSKPKDPTPSTWPLQFHSNQLVKLTYDLEWDNGTSFIYTNKECRVLHFEVGVLRPNWLDEANYLGQQHKDGFLCNVWEKVDFIWYYEDVITKRPVYWAFYTGYTAHVMTFEVGAVLEDSEWQAPVYCFKEDEEKRKQAVIRSLGMISRLLVKLMRGVSSASMAL